MSGVVTALGTLAAVVLFGVLLYHGHLAVALAFALTLVGFEAGYALGWRRRGWHTRWRIR